MNIYQARLRNAIRIAEKINKYIDADYMVFDEDGELITRKFVIDEEGVKLPVSDNCIVGYFMDDLEFDNGYYTTIPEYNKTFKKWTFVHPKHIRKLRGI